MWNDKLRHQTRVSIKAIIKRVDSDLMSSGTEAERRTAANGLWLFFKYFNYKLDLIKSFCVISWWPVITSIIKKKNPEPQNKVEVFSQSFLRENMSLPFITATLFITNTCINLSLISCFLSQERAAIVSNVKQSLALMVLKHV